MKLDVLYYWKHFDRKDETARGGDGEEIQGKDQMQPDQPRPTTRDDGSTDAAKETCGGEEPEERNSSGLFVQRYDATDRRSDVARQATTADTTGTTATCTTLGGKGEEKIS